MNPRWLKPILDFGVQRLWVLDFEYEVSGGAVVPNRVVCMVAHDLISGRRVRLGPDELRVCPFRCDSSELFVAYYAIAEAGCFLALGWPLPPQWIDVFVEERRLLVGSQETGLSLLDAMCMAGLPVRDATRKNHMQMLIGEGRWAEIGITDILAYCEEDVSDTAALLMTRCESYLSNAPGGLSPASIGQAIVRGRFMVENARMASIGLPIDMPTHQLIRQNAEAIRRRLVEEVERAHGFDCYEGTTFKRSNFAKYLKKRDIDWPQTPTGALVLADDTFKDYSEIYPAIRPLHELRKALAVLKSNKFVVDDDGRARTHLRPFTSKTGRSQPSSASYLFGLPKWMRSLLKPGPRRAIAYLDYSSQEIAIAAALSGDAQMLAGYNTGDPYLQFAKDAGLVPPDATKTSHPEERRKCKAIVLGVNYGMGVESLAKRAGISNHEADVLLRQHERTYPTFWSWVNSVRDRGAMGLPIYTPYGWRMHLRDGSDLNLRSLGNWPVQSTGSDILRVATILTANACVAPIATVHDALVFEFPTESAEALVETAKINMVAAAKAVIGVEVRVDARITCFPDVYVDDEAGDFYDRVLRLAYECEAV